MSEAAENPKEGIIDHEARMWRIVREGADNFVRSIPLTELALLWIDRTSAELFMTLMDAAASELKARGAKARGQIEVGYDYAAPNIVFPLAIALCDHLSDEDLTALQKRTLPEGFADMLSQAASKEISRRKAVSGPDLGEVGAS